MDILWILKTTTRWRRSIVNERNDTTDNFVHLVCYLVDGWLTVCLVFELVIWVRKMEIYSRWWVLRCRKEDPIRRRSVRCTSSCPGRTGRRIPAAVCWDPHRRGRRRRRCSSNRCWSRYSDSRAALSAGHRPETFSLLIYNQWFMIVIIGLGWNRINWSDRKR